MNAADPSRSIPGPPAPGLHAFAWAGLLLYLPESYRPVKIEGDRGKGLIALSDSSEVRLEIRWAGVSKRKFDAERYTLKHLQEWVGRHRKDEVAEQARELGPEHFERMRLFEDEDSEWDRVCAYSPVSKRAFDIAYWKGKETQNRQMRDVILPAIFDQSPDQPTHWAFFDHSFTVPAGFHYSASDLKIGDMALTVKTSPRWKRDQVITVRQIYPAKLALTRQPLGDWLAALIDEERKKKTFNCGTRRRAIREREFDTITTARGEGIMCTWRLRWALRPFLWQFPRSMEMALIHDEDRNRLIVVETRTRPGEHESLRDEVLDSLYWALEMRKAADDGA